MYKYYNPNPKAKLDRVTGQPKKWNVGDCVIRAICCATGKQWHEVFKLMCDIALKYCMMPNERKVIDVAMKQLGFTKVSYPQGSTREMVKDFPKNHPNTVAILNLAGHVVCCKNGSYYDTWDCGYKTAYNYWVKQ